MAVKKFLKGFVYAFNGLAYTVGTQLNFRVHLLATLLVVIAGCYYHLDRFEWLWIIAAITMVLVAELVNTAVEKLVDMVSPQRNPNAGIVKDVAAGAVLVAALAALVIALFIFGPRLFHAS